MDPLHPIIPIAPGIPPITPAPVAGRVNRDAARSGSGRDQRRRRRTQSEAGADPISPAHDSLDYADGEDDSGLHINVTA